MSTRDTSQFDRLAAERTSEAGRAAVDVARDLYASANSVAMITEARQWVALSLDCDKAIADGKINELAARIAAKSAKHELADRMRAAIESDDSDARIGRH